MQRRPQRRWKRKLTSRRTSLKSMERRKGVRQPFRRPPRPRKVSGALPVSSLNIELFKERTLKSVTEFKETSRDVESTNEKRH
jgi:hypothetical protein